MKLQEDIAERMCNPAFAESYDALEPEFQVARQVIALRLQRGLTQRELAERIGTKQSGISRLESMEQLPSLSYLKRVAEALDAQLQIQLIPKEASR